MTPPGDPKRGPPAPNPFSLRPDSAPGSDPFGPMRTPTAASGLSAQLGKVTEVHLVNTALGPAKLQETSRDKSFLILRALPADVDLVPYIDHGAVAGAYRVDPVYAMPLGPGVLRYPVVEVVPTLFFEAEDHLQLERLLAVTRLQLRCAEDLDVTGELRPELGAATLLWKSHAAASFDLPAFTRRLHTLRSSPRFERLVLVRLDDGERWLMTLERALPSAMREHPYFERIDQREAVRLRLGSGQEAWLTPLRATP